MLTQKFTRLKKGDLIFSEKHTIMADVTSVTDDGFMFFVTNGVWDGGVDKDGLYINMPGYHPVGGGDYVPPRKKYPGGDGGFLKVLALTSDEAGQWYLGNSNYRRSGLINDELAEQSITREAEDEPTKVFEASITIRVMGEEDSPARFAQLLSNMTMSQILREMDQGTFIGQRLAPVVAEVPVPEVAKNLEGLGNDGSFFNTGDFQFPQGGEGHDLLGEIEDIMDHNGLEHGEADEVFLSEALAMLKEAGLDRALIKRVEKAAEKRAEDLEQVPY